jgi:hypothetical protein
LKNYFFTIMPCQFLSQSKTNYTIKKLIFLSVSIFQLAIRNIIYRDWIWTLIFLQLKWVSLSSRLFDKIKLIFLSFFLKKKTRRKFAYYRVLFSIKLRYKLKIKKIKKTSKFRLIRIHGFQFCQQTKPNQWSKPTWYFQMNWFELIYIIKCIRICDTIILRMNWRGRKVIVYV